MTSEVKGKCFVIMPFSNTSKKHTEEYWTKHYKTFIKPLIESEHPLKAERSAPLRGDILRQIITDLVTVPIAVADLTDANPNVYWELGVRQSFKHGTVTIAEHGTDLPFDLGGKGTLFYFPDNHLKMQEFIKQFHNAIEDCLENPDLPDSHVLDTIGGRGTLYQITMRGEILRKLDAVLSELEDNQATFDRAIETCKKNINLRKEKKSGVLFTTSLLRTSAVELLVTNRYIDAEIDFYYLAEQCLDDYNKINTRLVDWPSRPSTIEPWLLREEDSYRQHRENIQEQIEAHVKSIKASL